MHDTRAMPNGTEREGEHWNARLIREKAERKAAGAWEMPDWMEQYRDLIGNTGGNTVEDLLYRLETTERLAFTNIVVFTMATDVKAQVGLLYRLRQAGMLRGEPR
ncbi:hypothetical protein [Micromonospora maritima]|uniref:hypothetical protein n=1 Tax=Micromonospora maritima TaxID=986711 RepID=UPI00157C3CF6|nr:hypothetical protein [Micromonospora maritima]